jgi:hypothetical protein
VKEEFLVALNRVMKLEEKRLERSSAVEQMKVSGLGVSGLGFVNKVAGSLTPTSQQIVASSSDVETTISGSVLQQHIQTICDLLGHTLESMRFAAVELIGMKYLF